jgi:regulator of nucleoside diphosphate kinase
MIAESEYRRLSALAQSAALESLLEEIERADIAPDSAIPPSVVRMGSSVRYRTEDGQERTVRLVWPHEADIEAARISVATPIGAALIGVREGHAIDWIAHNGRLHRLTVLCVGADGDAPGPQAA